MHKKEDIRLAPVIGCGFLAVTLGILAFGQNSGQAWVALQSPTSEKFLKLADAIKAGNKDDVKKLTAELAKVDHDEIMDAFKDRSKGGTGVGDKGTIKPDGVESKLDDLSAAAPSEAALKKEGAALEKMAHVIAGVAEVALAKGPPTDKAALKDDWVAYAKQMKDASENLRKAVQAKNGKDVQTAATKLIDKCAVCHKTFK